MYLHKHILFSHQCQHRKLFFKKKDTQKCFPSFRFAQKLEKVLSGFLCKRHCFGNKEPPACLVLGFSCKRGTFLEYVSSSHSPCDNDIQWLVNPRTFLIMTMMMRLARPLNFHEVLYTYETDDDNSTNLVTKSEEEKKKGKTVFNYRSSKTATMLLDSERENFGRVSRR